MIVNSLNELFVLNNRSSDYPVTLNAFQTDFKGGPPFSPSGIGLIFHKEQIFL